MRFERELTAAVLIPAVLAVLVAAPAWAFSVLVALAATAALLEFYGLIEAAGWIVPKPAGVGLFLAFIAGAHLASLVALAVITGVTLLALPTLVMFATSREAAWLASAASSVFATLYVALGAGAMVGLRAIGWQPVLFLFAVVWAGDSAAYYVGRRWGKRKLAPVVSPKKTWEGLWGQMGGGLVFGAGVAVLLFPASQGVPRTLLVGAVLGLVVSAVSVVGDLLESTFKRSCAVKDSGGLLPGHGGLLDRLDSLLYASPVLFGALVFVPEALPR
jgi:phosphatidate cytidylyltransferase